MKTILKKILPNKILNYLLNIHYLRISRINYGYDIKRFIQHSNAFFKDSTQSKLLAVIIAEYHVVEKGLSMPNMRFGFGQDRVTSLINHCELYAKKFDIDNDQYQHTLSVIREYYEVHNDVDHSFSQAFNDKLNQFITTYNAKPSSQTTIRRQDYYLKESQFEVFSNSRRSIRAFDGKIELEKLKKAVLLAQNTPSACNRQPSRSYIVDDRTSFDAILEIQSGNRGFGNLADKMIVVTSDVSSFLSIEERNDCFVNGGMFAMNLLYALHHNEVACCTLNWCSTIENDQKIRRVLPMSDSEAVVLIILCGNIPNEFKVALSPRTHLNNVMTVV